MGPLLAAAIPTAVSAIGSFIGGERANAANARAAGQQMDFQREQNRKQMEFQERMSSSSFQRVVEDLKRAGLNPALAYQQGGASSPGGVTSAGAAAHATDTLTPAISSAQGQSRLRSDMETAGVQRAAIAGQARAAQATAEQVEEQTRQLKMQGALLLEELGSRVEGNRSSATRNIADASMTQFNLQQARANSPLVRSLLEAQIDRESSSANEARARIGYTKVQTRLGELEIPRLENVANAQDTWFMKYIAPFLGSASAVRGLLPGR